MTNRVLCSCCETENQSFTSAMSERTSASTSEIANMISRIQSGTHEAVASMTTGEAQATQGVALANRAGEAIAEIRDSAQRVTGVVTAISDSIRQQSAASGEISTRIADDKCANIAAAGAGAVVRGDLGCMHNIEGRLRRRGDDSTRVLHVAEVLAGPE